MYRVILLLLLLLPSRLQAAPSDNDSVLLPTFVVSNNISLFLQEQVRLAIEASQAKFGAIQIVQVSIPVEAKRQLKNLTDQITDIAWASCTEERLMEYSAVEIPLLGGLLGHRVGVVRKNDKRFEKVSTVEDLKPFIFAQSSKWLDYDVLTSNGLTVLDTDRFSAYRALESSVADIFPRGINEVADELAEIDSNNLSVEPRLILNYPIYYIIYVSERNPLLKQRLEYGLGQMINSGQFTEHLEKQRWYALAEQLMQNRKMLVLENNNTQTGCENIANQYSQLLYSLN